MMRKAGGKRQTRRRPSYTRPAECVYCVAKKEPDYKDIEVLSKLLTERGKIFGRNRSGLCQKHQKRMTVAIKRARYLALIA